MFRSNKINKQSDGSYSIENRSENSFIANDSEFGIMNGALISERGVHLRDIGMDGFNELSNPYSASYNPNATVKIDWADRAYYLGSLLGLASPTAKIATASKAVGNVIPEGKLANHIFSGKAGKLLDNPTNRSLITDLTNNSKNLLGVDKYGKSWYARALNDGTQLYGYTQGGVVKGAGINQTPLNIIKNQGLK